MVADDSDHNWIKPLNKLFCSRFVGVASACNQLKKFVARHLRSWCRFKALSVGYKRIEAARGMSCEQGCYDTKNDQEHAQSFGQPSRHSGKPPRHKQGTDHGKDEYRHSPGQHRPQLDGLKHAREDVVS
jgi:hypothetical protein